MQITINDKKIESKEGQTILEIAKENGIEIPSLCYHSDLKPKASCRTCLVEVKYLNQEKPALVTACSTQIEQGMKIITDTPEIRQLRKTNLELIFSQHQEECADCVWKNNCQLLKLAKEYEVKINRFTDRKKDYPAHYFNPTAPDTLSKEAKSKAILEFDSSKCIDCGNCIEACQQQAVNYLEKRLTCQLPNQLNLKTDLGASPSINQENAKCTFWQVSPSQRRECIFCGQCLLRCPAGAFEAVGEFESASAPLGATADKGDRKTLTQKDKTVVVQFAPSIRTSIGEEFGLPLGEVVTEKITAGLKKLGADKVFDVSVGADFTTAEEAQELIHKIEKGDCATLFSSCCPAWVRFCELYWPEFVPQIATARPPHIISGGLIKTYYSQKNKQKPEDIFVVSIMPCVAKKYEITRPELLIDLNNQKIKPVDMVLTTRELTRLFLKHKINLKKIKGQKADAPLGIPSGAGVIYGASGGVMESALRAAALQFGGKTPTINFEKVRGQQGIKIAEIELAGRKFKMAAVSGTGNADKILRELKDNPKAFDCVEVMACPGGCIGGGGQPLPTDSQTRLARANGLYQIDKTAKIRVATENPVVKKMYKDFLTNPEIIKAICHANYNKK